VKPKKEVVQLNKEDSRVSITTTSKGKTVWYFKAPDGFKFLKIFLND